MLQFIFLRTTIKQSVCRIVLTYVTSEQEFYHWHELGKECPRDGALPPDRVLLKAHPGIQCQDHRSEQLLHSAFACYLR